MTRRKPFPDPPEQLSGRAKQLWAQIGHECKEPGRLILFEQALEALDRADAAQDMVRAEGLTVTTERSGVAHAHPMIRVEADARRMFFRLWTALGLQCRAS